MPKVNAIRDENFVPVALGVKSTNTAETTPFTINPVTGRLLVDQAGGGSGTVTSIAGGVGIVTSPNPITTTGTVSLTTPLQPIATLTGNAGKFLRVNAGETAVEYATVSGSGTVTSVASADGSITVTNPTTTVDLAVVKAPIWSTARLLAGNSVNGSANVAFANKFIVQGTTDTGLSAAQFLGALATGLVMNTTTTGVLSIATAGTDYVTASSTNTFTNKTYDTAGAGNSFSINGVAVTANQGTGAVVRATSPTLTTPVLGVATATSINGLTITTTTGTLTMTNAKTLAVTNSLTLSGTDSTVMTFPTTSKTIAANDGSNWTIASQAIGDILTASSTTAYTRLAAVAVGSVLVSAGTGTQPVWSAGPQVTTIELGSATDTTLSRLSAGQLNIEGVQALTASNTVTVTNKRNTLRVSALSANSATPALNTDNFDVLHITAQSAAITSFTTNFTGTPVDGDRLRISITGTGAVALTWGLLFESSTQTLPTTTVSTARLDIGFLWNTETTKWRCVSVA